MANLETSPAVAAAQKGNDAIRNMTLPDPSKFSTFSQCGDLPLSLPLLLISAVLISTSNEFLEHNLTKTGPDFEVLVQRFDAEMENFEVLPGIDLDSSPRTWFG